MTKYEMMAETIRAMPKEMLIGWLEYLFSRSTKEGGEYLRTGRFGAMVICSANEYNFNKKEKN